MDIDTIQTAIEDFDFNSRDNVRWQILMEMFTECIKPIDNPISKPLTEREIRILSTLFPNKLSYEDVELIVRRVEYLHDIGL
jgi:hypothetical protein